ncbi:Hypothetical predicted protein [Lynx pardinus]|uniref:Uncharacterized protein n=1 Tax=Lynx pardinus TaxID=191816 RepID=A0A485PRV4_LYNPA|nr:Hypothetical predicted protein [Lynx pardinus]
MVGRTTPDARVSVTALPQVSRGVSAATEGRAEKHVTRDELERLPACKRVIVPEGGGPLTVCRQHYGRGLWGRSCAQTLAPARPPDDTVPAKKCRIQAE